MFGFETFNYNYFIPLKNEYHAKHSTSVYVSKIFIFFYIFRAIVAILMDEDAYTIDHLVSLKPVQYLEGELIHDVSLLFFSTF